jgi:integrase
MAQKLNRLSSRFVASISKKGTYADGGGLFLQVGIAGQAKSWIFMYRRGRFGNYLDRRGYVGLGPVTGVSLAAAREKAQECRELLARKPPIDPRTEFQRRAREQARAHIKTNNFLDMANSYLLARENDPEKPLHVTTRKGHDYNLNRYLKPLHEMPPVEITASDIYKIIQPLRQAGRRSTAHNNRLLAYRIIEWARANEAFPKTEINPASMDGPLRVLLNTDKTDPVSKPHPALHFNKIPALFAKLELVAQRTQFTLGEAARAVGKSRFTLYNLLRCGRLIGTKPERPFSSRSMDQWLIEPAELFKVYLPGLPSVALHALKYQILTAARPGEALGMRWPEWEEAGQVWHVPWQRLKQGARTRQDHYVPLSEPAIAILYAVWDQQRRVDIETEFVFGSYRAANPTNSRLGIPPCKSTLHSLLAKNVDAADIDKTLHGMRTAFGSWARQLGYQEADIERGLSHIKGYGSDHVVRLYGRDATREDPLRVLFADWANYCLYGEPPADRVLRAPAEAFR